MLSPQLRAVGSVIASLISWLRMLISESAYPLFG